MIELQMKSGREKSLERRHPWIFSGAILGADGEPANGDVVDVVSGRGDWLGRGLYSATSQIAVRILTFDRAEMIDASFFQRRLEAAWRRREGRWDPKERNAVRWVHGEGDGLPGLVVDRYADVVSIQVQTAGMDRWKDAIADAIAALAPGCAVYERSDTGMRVLEGLEEVSGPLRSCCRRRRRARQRRGRSTSRAATNGLLPRPGGQLGARRRPARGACSTRSSRLRARVPRGGAEHVLALDSSQDALGARADLAQRLGRAPCERLCRRLHGCAASATAHELRPRHPRSAQVRRLEGPCRQVCRAYKDINLLAFKLLNPAGCWRRSPARERSPELFKVVADAALDLARRMLARYTQRPTTSTLACPEDLSQRLLLSL